MIAHLQFRQSKKAIKMKKIILSSGIALLVMNLLFGLLLSIYDAINLSLSSAVIVITTLLLYLINAMTLKDGYKISLLFLFIAIGFIEYLLSFFAPNQVKENWWLIIIMGLFTIEFILLVITTTISKRIK